MLRLWQYTAKNIEIPAAPNENRGGDPPKAKQADMSRTAATGGKHGGLPAVSSDTPLGAGNAFDAIRSFALQKVTG
jgi:hypothetical protein